MKILLPVDGSDHTKHMLAWLTTHSEWLGNAHEYTVLTVVPPIPPHAMEFLDPEFLRSYDKDQAEVVFKPIQAEAQAKGIKWITYGSTLPGQDGELDLQQEIGGQTIGKLAGEWIAKNKDALGGKAKVALLTYEKGEWAQNRRKGIEEGLEQSASGMYEVVARQDALSETEGLNVTNTLLQAHPDLNVVLAIEETATEGAYQAFVNSGHPKDDPKVFLGGIDGTLKALQLLKEGDTIYRGSAALSLKSIGEGIVSVADGLLSGSQPAPYIFKVPYTPLTPGAPEVETFLKEWGQG